MTPQKFERVTAEWISVAQGFGRSDHEEDRFLAGCSGNSGRHRRIKGPRSWAGRWRNSPCLRNQNSSRIPRLESDLRSPRGSNLNDLRAVLGNDIAIKAYREQRLPFPDGAIIARLAWSYIPSEENNKVFGRKQSFVAGPPTNVRFMVKDSKKYAATGDWGFAQFKDGKPADEAAHKPALLATSQPRLGILSLPATHPDTKHQTRA
jgi:Cytochrome P460